ncbi:3-methyl-2-oxobutanoate hydroxymethyltransferase [Jiella sp. M17.18]|uniref:3-methyl-2-oxobutanoate hydroxymethyltransferase n=1 Tax=Jiella sp. M17.18 TaxID=3234247 RepID=UPI0034DE14DA
MSTPAPNAKRRLTAPAARARKGGVPLVMVTAYSATMARLVDPAVDMILVGDSLAMVEHGMPSTLGAGLDLMIAHGKAVVSASETAMVVVDLPFGAYESGPADAFRAAARVMAEAGCDAVKLEGGTHMAETIRFLSDRGVPVVAHIGLTPQAVNALGGFRSQGHDDAAREKILADARAVAEAGAFAVVVEGVVAPLGKAITEAIDIPTIGIGASAECDGQVLVLEDLLGLTPRAPRFVKRYAELGQAVSQAVGAYADEVRARTFPGEEHTYKPRG